MLDVGSGTGYPALLSAQVVGPDGHVVGIDLAERMLAVAGRKATKNSDSPTSNSGRAMQGSYPSRTTGLTPSPRDFV